MTNSFSRRTLAQGAAWSLPAIAVAGAAPAFAASTGKLNVRFYRSAATCPVKGGVADIYLYVNLQNNTTSPVTLATPLVLTIQSTNPNRNFAAPSTSTAGSTIACVGGGALTSCPSATFTWTVPTGTTIPAGGEVDFAIHFWSQIGQPTSVTASTSDPRVIEKTRNTATDGYAILNGSCSGTF